MKAHLLFALLLAGFASSANAAIYHWYQTSASLPGLIFTASYGVVDGEVPPPANSTQSSPDFGGLWFYEVSGGGNPAVSLSDLVPACTGSPSCIEGYPDWSIDVPALYFIDANDSFDYFVTAHSIQADTDDASSPCFDSGTCVARGYWSSSVPEPATIFALAGGLLLIGRARARRALSCPG